MVLQMATPPRPEARHSQLEDSQAGATPGLTGMRLPAGLLMSSRDLTGMPLIYARQLYLVSKSASHVFNSLLCMG